MEDAKIVVKSSGPCSAVLDWSKCYSADDASDYFSGRKDGLSQDTKPQQSDGNKKDEKSGFKDTYEDYLDLAYTRPTEDNEANELEEIDDSDEEAGQAIDTTQVFSFVPHRTCLVQRLVPRKGWQTVYHGSLKRYLVKNLPADQTIQFRLKIYQNEVSNEKWKYFGYHNSGIVSSGRELFEAAARGNASDVTHVVSRLQKNAQACSVDACVEEGSTPLVACAWLGEKEAFAMLLEGGAGVLVSTGGPCVTPVHGAAWGGYDSLIKRMETAGAAWTDLDRSNMTALEYAIMNCQDHIVDYVSRSSSGSLHEVVWQEPVLNILVLACAYQNSKISKKSFGDNGRLDKDKTTILENIADTLLDNGVDVNQPGRNGNTPLHMAVILKQDNLVEKFLLRGGDINKPNEYGFTPKQLLSLLDQQSNG